MNSIKQLVRSSRSEDTSIAVYSYGATTKYPVYTVEEFVANQNSGRIKHTVLHVCSGKYAKENAFKRYRMFAFGTEYRSV